MSVAGEPTRLGLEVDFDAEPIEGRLLDAGRPDRPFSGWLGLMAAIEAARPAEVPGPRVHNGDGGGRR
jgi:hypothetical protein